MDRETSSIPESKLNKTIASVLKVFGFFPSAERVGNLKRDLSLSESTDNEISLDGVYQKIERLKPTVLMPFRRYAEPELDTVYLYVVCEVLKKRELCFPRQKIQELTFYAKQLDERDGFVDVDDAVNCAIEKMVAENWSMPRGFPQRLICDEVINVSDLSETESYESSHDEESDQKNTDSRDDELVQSVIDFVNHKSSLRDSI